MAKLSTAQRQAALEKDVYSLRPLATTKVIEKLTKKVKKGKAGRIAKQTSSQVTEEPKQLLCMRGHKCSGVGQQLLKDLCVARAPLSVNYTRRNSEKLINAMETPEELAFLPVKSRCNLFAMGSTTKKRPLRLLLGRIFAERLYDVYEFDVLEHTRLETKANEAPGIGSKPVVIFLGSLWETSEEFKGAQNILADVFGGIPAARIALDKFDHAYVCTAYDKADKVGEHTPVIKVSHFFLKLKKDPENPKVPKVVMKNIGPDMLLKLARSKLPDADTKKRALRIPNEEWEKGSKKTTTNALLETEQRLHINTQSFKDLHLRHGGSAKKSRPADDEFIAGSDDE